LTENGLGTTSAEAVAHILSSDDHYSILDLSGNRLRDEGAFAIAKLLGVNQSLVHLGLCSNDIGYEGGCAIADALADNNTITSLDLGAESGINRNHLGSRGATALGKMLKVNSVLCMLSVSSNGLGADGMSHLAAGMGENRTLTQVNLASNNLGPEGARLLASVIESTELQSLDLQRNAIGDRGGQLLCQALSRTVEANVETLHTLDLQFNDLKEGAAKKIASLVSASQYLTILRLCGNEFGTGAKDLADAVGESKRLEELSLSECCLRKEDGLSFGAALANNKKLLRLDLSKNRLCDQGITAIVDALRRNRVLLSLNLSSNLITDVGGIAIAKMLRENQSLQELNLRHNSMTTVSGDVIDDELHHNTSIQRMDVTFNDFTYKCFSGIQHTLQRNSAAWAAQVVPRLNGEIEVLDVRQKELLQVQEDMELERRITKDRSDQLLRRKEEIRASAEKFRLDLNELDEVVSAARHKAEQAEEAHRFAEDKLAADSSSLSGKRSNMEGRTQAERDKRDRIQREIEKLKRQLKTIQDAEAEVLKPLQAEFTRFDNERNSDKADCRFQSEQLAAVSIKRKQLETQLGLSTAGVSPVPQSVNKKPAPGKK
jgi:Ran GTPase-activating protein (RanGAP) involved in mRNA processing and transport